jgi:hypothetical protein
MRTFGSIGAIFILLVVGAGVVVKLTAGERAKSARDTLERAAREFVECYERVGSYARCDPGTSKVNVTFQSRKAFALASSVEFGPTYEISRRGEARLIRNCQPLGSRCPVGKWRR